MTKFATPLGEIAITVLGHASLLIRWEGRNIFVDPYAKVADYSKQPAADLILVTHHHYDHLDKFAISKIAAAGTEFVASSLAAKELEGATALKIGEECSYEGIQIKAVYAYNVENKADNGLPFHPKGEGNGYILNFGGFRVYIAGDTELIPEMKELGKIDLAFLPKNLPYTMSDDMFIKAVETVMPVNLIPYHYFELNEREITKRLPKGVTMHVK